MDNIIYRVVTAVVFSSFFLLLAILLKRSTFFTRKYGINFILVVLTIGLVRMIFPYEPPFSQVIPSYSILVKIQQFARTECFVLYGYSFTIGIIALLIWSMGTTILLCRILVHMVQTNYFIKHTANKKYTGAQEVLNQIVQQSKSRSSCGLLVTDQLYVPMQAGYFRPTIILPTIELSQEELHFVLLHEWSHFLHKDLWKKLLLNIIVAFLWWNPLIYLAKLNFDFALEVDCDKRVTLAMPKDQRLIYIETALTAMKHAQPHKKPKFHATIALVGTKKHSNTATRCKFILFPPVKMKKSLTVCLYTMLIALVLVSYIFIIQPRDLSSDDSGILHEENSYLVETENGKYELFVEGVCVQKFPIDDMDTDVLASMPVIREGE